MGKGQISSVVHGCRAPGGRVFHSFVGDPGVKGGIVCYDGISGRATCTFWQAPASLETRAAKLVESARAP